MTHVERKYVHRLLNIAIPVIAGNPHAAFVEAGVGNGLLSTAPTFDPTLGGGKGAARLLPYPVAQIISCYTHHIRIK